MLVTTTTKRAPMPERSEYIGEVLVREVCYKADAIVYVCTLDGAYFGAIQRLRNRSNPLHDFFVAVHPCGKTSVSNSKVGAVNALRVGPA